MSKLLMPRTRVRCTKLINFEGNRAEYHHDGVIYECTRIRGVWYITFNYTYA